MTTFLLPCEDSHLLVVQVVKLAVELVNQELSYHVSPLCSNERWIVDIKVIPLTSARDSEFSVNLRRTRINDVPRPRHVIALSLLPVALSPPNRNYRNHPIRLFL